jgi:hypothetical protein
MGFQHVATHRAGRCSLAASFAFSLFLLAPRARAQAPVPTWASATSASTSTTVPKPQPWRTAREGLPTVELEQQPAKRTWYGWQTLLSDGLSLAALVLLRDADDFSAVGLGLLVLGSPIVHFAHENLGSGAISLGIRAASLGLFGGGLVLVVEDDVFDGGGSSEDNTLGGVLIVASVAGIIAAIAIDASLLAYDKAAASRSEMARFAPWLDPKRGTYGIRYALAL